MISCSTEILPRSPAYRLWEVTPTLAPPTRSTEPESASELPARISSSVVLPAPLRPTTPIFSPASTESEAPERTFRSPPWYFTMSLATMTFMTGRLYDLWHAAICKRHREVPRGRPEGPLRGLALGR